MKYKKSQVLKLIFEHIERDFVYDYETYEQFPIIDGYYELDPLLDKIEKNSRMSVLTSLAITYINMGIIYANEHIPSKDISNYLIFGGFVYDVEDINEVGFCTPEIYFTKKAKETFQFYDSELIDIHKDILSETIANVIGIDDFYWYRCLDQYYFVPKIMRKVVPFVFGNS